MSDSYYALFLDNPAVPAYWSEPKLYVGQKQELLSAADRMDSDESYPGTAESIRRYFEGDLQATHNIAYQTIPVLTPVSLIEKTEKKTGILEWNHINVWGCTYKMRISSADIEQIVIKYDMNYYRCIRASFKNLCFQSQRNEWYSVGEMIFGNHCVLEIDNTAKKPVMFRNTLYVTEDTSSTDNDLIKVMHSDLVDFRHICDEIFGDG